MSFRVPTSAFSAEVHEVLSSLHAHSITLVGTFRSLDAALGNHCVNLACSTMVKYRATF